jgi:hypothetical protein
MRLFAKYSQPGSEILTAASYVLGGETDEFVDILKNNLRYCVNKLILQVLFRQY